MGLEIMGNINRLSTALLLSLLLSVVTSTAQADLFGKKSKQEQREELQEARESALATLYAKQPSLETQVAQSKGYAVFSNIGLNLLMVSTQRGGGILRDNRSRDDTYMNMFSAGGGVGMGVKEYAAVFVFHTDEALEAFSTKGWDFSAQADAKYENEDDSEGLESAITAMPGVSLYQITERGVSAQVTLQGTKFWVDDDLN